jgi:hypothetical protein
MWSKTILLTILLGEPYEKDPADNEKHLDKRG